MEIHAVNIIYDICVMSALMLIAKIIRTKIKIIQKLDLSELKEGIATLKKNMCNKATLELVKKIKQYYNL